MDLQGERDARKAASDAAAVDAGNDLAATRDLVANHALGAALVGIALSATTDMVEAVSPRLILAAIGLSAQGAETDLAALRRTKDLEAQVAHLQALNTELTLEVRRLKGVGNGAG